MRDVHNDVSVVSVVNTLLDRAIAMQASDIHLEPTESSLRVRFRLDGVLHDQPSLGRVIAQQVVSRFKVLSAINIAEKRIPQDGKFNVFFKGQLIDLRLSTFPSLYGEKIVVRILDRATHGVALEHVGFNGPMLTAFNTLIKQSSGFFLVTGPTGSGKTTTLYAALSALNSPEKNIVTLEDPVEYNLKGITQGYINNGAGFTFEKGIRALLRQDPDVLMVGEIRDKQTARVAIEAALTGHLVLSTLHTNDAPSAVMRLMDMGIEPFLINASLTGVLAQRLVRKICNGCKKQEKPTEQETHLLHELAIDPHFLYKGVGCADCNNLGYKGRTGIFELLTVTNALRSLIVSQPVFEDIYQQARTDGMSTLMHDGVQKVRDGIISLADLARIIV
ncbi:MAG: GspE/PulE family protein [Candidatus Dependentiae bacterium]|nr:GspE/PulE family protein [Candidatus Dependentiae bacterium]